MSLRKITLETFIDFPQNIHPERLFVLSHIPKEIHYGCVADVGCGSHKTHPQMIGIDPRRMTDLVGDAENLPLDNLSVDAIVMRHSLEHVLNQTKAVMEWKRVLRPNGIVIVVLPDHGTIDTMDYILSSGEHVHAYSMESFTDFMDMWFSFQFTVRPTVVIPEWSFGSVIRKL